MMSVSVTVLNIPACSKEMRKYSFNHMLLALALFDLLFIVCAVPTHVFPALELRHGWASQINQNREEGRRERHAYTSA